MDFHLLFRVELEIDLDFYGLIILILIGSSPKDVVWKLK